MSSKLFFVHPFSPRRFLRQRVIEWPSSIRVWISGDFGMTSGPPSSIFLLWKVAKWGPSFTAPPSVNCPAFRRRSAGAMRGTALTRKADGFIIGNGRVPINTSSENTIHKAQLVFLVPTGSAYPMNGIPKAPLSATWTAVRQSSGQISVSS